MAQVLGCLFPGPVEDPKVAHWLLDPSAKEKNLHGMVAHYTQDQVGLLESKFLNLHKYFKKYLKKYVSLFKE